MSDLFDQRPVQATLDSIQDTAISVGREVAGKIQDCLSKLNIRTPNPEQLLADQITGLGSSVMESLETTLPGRATQTIPGGGGQLDHHFETAPETTLNPRGVIEPEQPVEVKRSDLSPTALKIAERDLPHEQRNQLELDRENYRLAKGVYEGHKKSGLNPPVPEPSDLMTQVENSAREIQNRTEREVFDGLSPAEKNAILLDKLQAGVSRNEGAFRTDIEKHLEEQLEKPSVRTEPEIKNQKAMNIQTAEELAREIAIAELTPEQQEKLLLEEASRQFYIDSLEPESYWRGKLDPEMANGGPMMKQIEDRTQEILNQAEQRAAGRLPHGEFQRFLLERSQMGSPGEIEIRIMEMIRKELKEQRDAMTQKLKQS